MGGRRAKRRTAWAIGLTAALSACGAKTALEAPAPSPQAPCAESFGSRAPRVCDPVTMGPPPASFDGVPLAILTGGCDIVVAVVAAPEGGPLLHVSTDGGVRFAAPRALPAGALPPSLGAPRFTTVALDDDGRLLALVRGDDEVLRASASDDLGASWDGPVVVTTEPDAWGPSIAVAGDEVVVSWLARSAPSAPTGQWIARSHDGARSFEPPLRLGDVRSAMATPASVCIAGSNGIVASWLDCTSTDCTGDDRDGIAIGSSATVVGDALHARELFRLDDGQHPPIAGCAPDGRALLAWSAAAYLETEDFDLVVRSLDACGVATETARFPGREAAFLSPTSPAVTLGPNGALLRWSIDFGVGGGLAILDRSGRLVSATLDGDRDADGAADVPVDACALPGGGYAVLLTAGPPSRAPQGGLAVLLGDDGSPTLVRSLGALEAPPVAAWVACDGRGRAHFLTRGVERAEYVALVAD